MMLNPTNMLPKIASWISNPGTNTCQASPGGKPLDFDRGSSSGPNSAHSSATVISAARSGSSVRLPRSSRQAAGSDRYGVLFGVSPKLWVFGR